LRWGQTNITERDPQRYDIAWWRQHWKRTHVQGVIVNAGGIVAYYPSRFPLHRRAEFLENRDLYGEVARAAHEDGLVVLARMDSNRAAEEFYKAHPDWFAIDASGQPYRAADKYITCINSPYYEEYLPGILVEIIDRSKPEGLTDNSWAGIGRESICYCEHCKRRFGKPLPRKTDWDDPTYRDWIEWSYARRIEIWDLNNRVTRQAGGPDCIWSGMLSGSFTNQSRTLRDYRGLCRRAAIVMLDHQRRSELGGFQQNTDAGLMIHGVLGWDKLIPESMPMYQMGRPTFRLSSKPEPEARMWMVAGFAGGIQPWWHHISAYHEDRRMHKTAPPVMQWHRANEQYLVNRRPVASVGVVWSQENTDFYGRDTVDVRVEQPWRGFTQALMRARIAFLPVHAEDIAREAERLRVLVLPNVGALSDAQVEAVRRFAGAGGSVVATGQTGLYTADGEARREPAFAELFGVRGRPLQNNPRGTRHTFLRVAEKHPVVEGFDGTAILPFGEELAPLDVLPGSSVPLTFIPEFPAFPPETAWMRTERTNIPALVLRETGKARLAFLPAPIERQYALHHLPDHGNLLAAIVRWAARGTTPFEVEGGGFLDCSLYEQGARRILHLVNLSNAQPWTGPLEEHYPLGPFRVRVEAPGARLCRLLVSGRTAPLTAKDGRAAFEVPRVVDHEVVVLE
jgi:hypothetical protein